MNFTPAIKEALSLHEIFRRLGFPAGDLYISTSSCSRHDCDRVHGQVVIQRGGPGGTPLFTVDIFEDCANLVTDWPAAVEWWNTPSNLPGVAQIFAASDAVECSVGLLLALETKGVTKGGRAS